MYQCLNPQYHYDPNTGAYNPCPCGHCLRCQERKRAEWDLRLTVESLHSSVSAFVTYTYDDDHLSEAHDYRNFQLLHKRMRNDGLSFSFYHVSEFGSRKGRPHNHELVFFASKVDPLVMYDYHHSGIVDVGTVTPASIHYVCKWHVHPKYRVGESRELHGFTRMSKGLGNQLVFDNDNFQSTYQLPDGRLLPVSRYYRKLYDIDSSDFHTLTLYQVYKRKYNNISWSDFLQLRNRLLDFDIYKQSLNYGNL